MSFSSKPNEEKISYMTAFVESCNELLKKIPQNSPSSIKKERILHQQLNIEYIPKDS